MDQILDLSITKRDRDTRSLQKCSNVGPKCLGSTVTETFVLRTFIQWRSKTEDSFDRRSD